MTSQPWPAALPVRAVRVARPTDRLDEVVRFYTDGLGLSELGRFDGHAGYRGVLLGLPGVEYHLESGVSMYFRDPDGARLELLADPLGEMYGSKVL